MAAIKIPKIDAKEYESFRSIGLSDQFPVDYISFIKMFNEETDNLCHGGIIPIYVDIDFSGFIAWFGVGKTATYDDLLHYAANA